MQEVAEVVLRVDFKVDPVAIMTAGRFASCVKKWGASPHGTNQAIAKEESIAGGRTWLRMISLLTMIPWVC
ncbi:BgTH12-03349 [Blumeria graminis f. sp. triticale]|uniref:BgTH12-03349 n=1 Tax=Blumeria graminis f. sp. triticale TaxID=1689686 RepID=A0A9W4GHA5_BLUGR|nr:BgTH12-03349 [Blumeria graminis f. sp. triticale]